MDLMRTARRSRAPEFPPWIPAEEIIAYTRERQYALERCHGGGADDKWSGLVERHMSKLNDPITATALPTPHSCIQCQKLVIDVSSPVAFDSSGSAIYPKFLDLQCSLQEAHEGAEAGCEFFQQLISQWRPSKFDEGDQEHYRVFAYGHVASEDEEFNLLAVANIGLIDRRRGWSKWDNDNHSDKTAPLAMASVYTEDDDPASMYLTGRPISIDPWSRKSIESTRSSLASCFKCSESSSNGTASMSIKQAPARLLAISKSNGEWSLRLEQLGVVVPRYCTLSYCWGPAQKGFTTIMNIEERGVTLDFAAVSKTIQDAIVVSWDLGIYYLWVDALCIIQDNEIDKAVEISKMSHIFENAYLTICTSRTLFADEGFLVPRSPIKKHSSLFRLAYQLPHQDSRGSVVLYQSSSSSGHNRLQSRAWGFQERMLSRRILDFDGTTTEYSCCHPSWDQTHECRDGGPAEHAHSWKTVDVYRRLFITFDDIAASTGDRMAVKDVNKTWADIIRQYTECSVSRPTDRVLAIAAVAERFSRYTQDEYIGGLWKRTLPWSLMWCMRTRQVRPPRPKNIRNTYQGPSWSWLSVNGPVHFFHAKELIEEAETVVEYITHEVDIRHDAAPYGAMNSASIALRGNVRRARWVRKDKLETIEDYDSLKIHELDKPSWLARPEDGIVQEHDDQAALEPCEEFIPARILPDALEPEFALPVASGGSAFLDVILLQMFKHKGVPVGVALRDPSANNEGFYERVGLFYMKKGEHLQRPDDKGEEQVETAEPAGETDAETKQGSKNQSEISDRELEDLLLRWEHTAGTDAHTDAALLNDVQPYVAGIGRKLESEIRTKIQEQREAQVWEKWKCWFDEEDNEAQILVLI